MSAKVLLALAVVLMLFHGVLRALGLAEHTSVIAGMPISDASWVLGPLYALSWLAFVTLAPIFTLTALFLAIGSRWKKRARPGADARRPGKARTGLGFDQR